MLTLSIDEESYIGFYRDILRARLVVAAFLFVGLACTKDRAMPKLDPVTPAVTPKREGEESRLFLCTIDGIEHEVREIGFNWPDAVLALSLPEDERERRRQGNNEEAPSLAMRASFVGGHLSRFAIAALIGALAFGFRFLAETSRRSRGSDGAGIRAIWVASPIKLYL